MQVSVEKTSELSRKMTVSVPDEVFQEKMTEKLKTLAREVKIHGFRPGKVPKQVLLKMYGEKIRGEIAGNLVDMTYAEALQEQSLRPIGYPQIHSSDVSEGFEYIAEFEVYPEISLEGLEQLEVLRPFSAVQEVDIDGTIEKLREQRRRWSIVDRAAQEHDRLTISFSGECEGENFTEGRIENFQVEIGKKQMIQGFDDNLIGLTVGANKAFDLSFPEDYGNEDLAGKVGKFEVDVISVEESTLPEIDEAFIKAHGIEGSKEEDFRAGIRANLESELEQVLLGKLKSSVMNALYEKIQIPVPTILVNQEIEKLMKPYIDDAEKKQMNMDDLKLPREAFEWQAKYRVALGLILGEIVHKNNIKLDDNNVRATIEDMAKKYDQPADIIAWYYEEDSRLNDVRQMVLERQTIDWLVGQAKVSDQTISFSAAMSR